MMADNGNGKNKVSRVVVEFVGVGMADIKAVKTVNVSVGQLQVLAAWAEFQARRAFMQLEAQNQQKRPPQIAIARLRPE
jgi:hypothetical protein